MSIGLLILRVVVGGLIVGHGAQKLFGWFGGHGPAGTGGFFHSIGFRPGRTMAVLAGFTELCGGTLLVLGLVTPLGAAMIIGMMTAAAIAVHLPNGLWASEGGYEFTLVNAAAACCLAFTGAGAWSLDNAIGLTALHGYGTGVGATLVGVVAALPLLIRRASLLRHEATQPYPSEQPAPSDVGVDIITR